MARERGLLVVAHHYPASEELEIINLVEQSHLPTRKTLDRLVSDGSGHDTSFLLVPIRDRFFLSGRFSSVRPATHSFGALDSRLRSLTSWLVAARVVLPGGDSCRLKHSADAAGRPPRVAYRRGAVERKGHASACIAASHSRLHSVSFFAVCAFSAA